MVKINKLIIIIINNIKFKNIFHLFHILIYYLKLCKLLILKMIKNPKAKKENKVKIWNKCLYPIIGFKNKTKRNYVILANA